MYRGRQASLILCKNSKVLQWSCLELLCVDTVKVEAGFDARLHLLSSICSSFLLLVAQAKVTPALSDSPRIGAMC